MALNLLTIKCIHFPANPPTPSLLTHTPTPSLPHPSTHPTSRFPTPFLPTRPHRAPPPPPIPYTRSFPASMTPARPSDDLAAFLPQTRELVSSRWKARIWGPVSGSSLLISVSVYISFYVSTSVSLRMGFCVRVCFVYSFVCLRSLACVHLFVYVVRFCLCV